jgi:hypothetical protein
MTEWHIVDLPTTTDAGNLVHALNRLSADGWTVMHVLSLPPAGMRIVARREVTGPLPRPHE